MKRQNAVDTAFLPRPKIPDIFGSLPSRDLRSVHGCCFLEASGAGDGSRQVTPDLAGKSRGQRNLAKFSNKHSMWSVSPDTGVSGVNLVVRITDWLKKHGEQMREEVLMTGMLNGRARYEYFKRTIRLFNCASCVENTYVI